MAASERSLTPFENLNVVVHLVRKELCGKASIRKQCENLLGPSFAVWRKADLGQNGEK